MKRSVIEMLAKEYPAAMFRKRHGTVYSTLGDPDISGLYRGVHIECELKRFGEEPTPLQAHRLEQWRQAGAVVAVIHTVQEMRDFMHALPKFSPGGAYNFAPGPQNFAPPSGSQTHSPPSRRRVLTLNGRPVLNRT